MESVPLQDKKELVSSLFLPCEDIRRSRQSNLEAGSQWNLTTLTL